MSTQQLMAPPDGPQRAEAVRPISHPSTNDRVLQLAIPLLTPGATLLDVGAGEGYFAMTVGDHVARRSGLAPSDVISACDVTPGLFRYPGVRCDLIDESRRLPYADDRFDVVSALEVVEHVQDQFLFCREILRVLKPGGTAIISTPNILNINSRLRFLHSGFATLFNPLSLSSTDVVHTSGHIHPVSYYYLAYALLHAGAETVGVAYDRHKRSAQALALALLPVLAIGNGGFRAKRRRKGKKTAAENGPLLDAMNDWKMLTARSIIVVATKPAA